MFWFFRYGLSASHPLGFGLRPFGLSCFGFGVTAFRPLIPLPCDYGLSASHGLGFGLLPCGLSWFGVGVTAFRPLMPRGVVTAFRPLMTRSSDCGLSAFSLWVWVTAYRPLSFFFPLAAPSILRWARLDPKP
jgi:hypothetical protein